MLTERNCLSALRPARSGSSASHNWAWLTWGGRVNTLLTSQSVTSLPIAVSPLTRRTGHDHERPLMPSRLTAEVRHHADGAAKVLLAALWALAVTACSKPVPAQEPVRAVRTLTVAASQAGGAVDYAAEVRARVESRLAFRVGGKMISRPAGLGDSVKAGQVLASLDPQDLRLGQEAARSAVRAASVSHEQALADFRRFKELRDQGFISAAELERRETTLKSAQALLEQARAQAGVQINQAGYSNLVADASGVVTAVEAEPGAVLPAGATVLRVAQDGPRDAVFSVSEDQAGALRALQGRPGALQVRIWGADRAALAATVREVAAAADPATRTFLVKADIGRTEVRLGQTATVSIGLPVVSGVIKLPLSAVFEQQGSSHVWLLDKATMTVRAQPIQVVGADGDQVVVAGGLAPGQQVVSAGVHVLTPGQKVALYGAAPTSAAAAAAASNLAR
jgi:membrane fusion protein, multidrug efflux system